MKRMVIFHSTDVPNNDKFLLGPMKKNVHMCHSTLDRMINHSVIALVPPYVEYEKREAKTIELLDMFIFFKRFIRRNDLL